MTGFGHVCETDDKTAGPDFICTVKLTARENKMWSNGEESTDGQTPGYGGKEI